MGELGVKFISTRNPFRLATRNPLGGPELLAGVFAGARGWGRWPELPGARRGLGQRRPGTRRSSCRPRGSIPA